MVALSEHLEQPGFPLGYEGNRWYCPHNPGVFVDTTLADNKQQRLNIVLRCEANPQERRIIMAQCRKSFLLWLNLFGWTYVIYQVKETGERVAKLNEKDQPFIAWPCQEGLSIALDTARASGRDLAVQKSRDMGATWEVIAWFVWMALFHGGNMGVASRKKDLVDRSGDPDAIFTKIDYMVKFLPNWMRGEVERTSMHIKFTSSGGTIDGESTNEDAFRGGRKHGIMFDEAAAMENLAAIVRASKDAGLRIFVSTHEEVSHFYDVVTSGRVDVFTLAWWDHPEKGRGRTLQTTPSTGEVKWTSPWYRIQLRDRDPKDMALNIDIKPGGDGSMVFDFATLIKQEATFGCAPYHVGLVRFDDGVSDIGNRAAHWPLERLTWVDAIMDRDAEAQWQLWCDPFVEDDDEMCRFRPDQSHGYVFGVDVGDGVGATPSVISVCDVDTGYKVGAWQSRQTRPEEFGMLLYQFGHWWGGTENVPLIVVEANGGRAVGILADLKRWRYPRIYRHIEPDRVTPEKSEQLGWMSNTRRKKALLAQYGGSLFRSEFRNPDILAVQECRQYIHMRDEMGRGSRVVPKRLGHLSDPDLAEHGDKVIADALADLGRIRAPLLRVQEGTPPVHSVGYQRARLQAIQKPDERALWKA